MCKPTTNTAELRATLEELARFGSPVDLSVATKAGAKGKIDVVQLGGLHDSMIFELQDGRIACAAAIAVTNQTSKTIYGVGVELRTSWGDTQWDWLEPRRIDSQGRSKGDYSYLEYRFPGKCGLQFEYNQVINHFLFEGRSLPSRRPLDGFLLGIGGVMPSELRHGQWLDLTLAVIGPDDTEYAENIRLRTERLEARPALVKRPSSLFMKEEFRFRAGQNGSGFGWGNGSGSSPSIAVNPGSGSPMASNREQSVGQPQQSVADSVQKKIGMNINDRV